MGIITFPSAPVADDSLAQYFSWAGARFPFNSGAADIVISGPTTWSDAVGYKKVGKLTISAGQTLTINKSPFYIFADEINFGDVASIIDASGLTSTASIIPTSSGMAKGGYGAVGQTAGGCGGGMLFVLCNKITGAVGTIKANGGNGYIGTSLGVNNAGQGAFSTTVNSTGTAEFFNHTLGYSALSYNGAAAINPTLTRSTLNLLGKGSGSNSTYIATGGGSGGWDSNSSSATGGSGIGGGGGGGSYNGSPALVIPSVLDLLALASLGCFGGGGGGSRLLTAGGGGGGSVVVFSHLFTATPTIQANGGVAGGGSAGAAGVTYLIVL